MSIRFFVCHGHERTVDRREQRSPPRPATNADGNDWMAVRLSDRSICRARKPPVQEECRPLLPFARRKVQMNISFAERGDNGRRPFAEEDYWKTGQANPPGTQGRHVAQSRLTAAGLPLMILPARSG